MKVPSDTKSLLIELEKMYPDKYSLEEYDTPTYWKKAGVIEILRLIRHELGDTSLNNINVKGY